MRASTGMIKCGTVARRTAVITSSAAGCFHEARGDSHPNAECDMQLNRTSNGLANPMTAIGYGSACALPYLSTNPASKQNQRIDRLIQGRNDL